MIWVTNTSLPGGEVGMVPYAMAIYLAIHLGAGIVLAIIFSKKFKAHKNRIIGIILYSLLFNFWGVFTNSESLILGMFEKGSEGEISRAFYLTTWVAGVLVAILIWILGKRKVAH